MFIGMQTNASGEKRVCEGVQGSDDAPYVRKKIQKLLFHAPIALKHGKVLPRVPFNEHIGVLSLHDK